MWYGQAPGKEVMWGGTYTLTGFSFDKARDLYAGAYDKAPSAVNKLIGTALP